MVYIAVEMYFEATGNLSDADFDLGVMREAALAGALNGLMHLAVQSTRMTPILFLPG